jgi:hypothetical protein
MNLYEFMWINMDLHINLQEFIGIIGIIIGIIEFIGMTLFELIKMTLFEYPRICMNFCEIR